MLRTEFAMTYLLEVEGPLVSAGGGEPPHQFWQMRHATLEGSAIRAASALPGIDWFTPGEGAFGRPHVRLPFRTEDGAIVLLEYHGVVEASAAFAAAVEHDTATDWDDQYMRMALFFETGVPRYRWLTESLFLARGRLRGAKAIEYEVHRLL
jgi:hypothetical protein